MNQSNIPRRYPSQLPLLSHYILPFYLSSATRPSRTLTRDAPSVIRARIRAISLSCVASSLVTIYVLLQYEHAQSWDILRFMGLWPIHGLAILKVLLLCIILFIGPLFEGAIAEHRLGLWLHTSLVHETFSSWIGWRNYVAGPVSEELVWRSLLIPLHLIAHVSPRRIVFCTPLYFGIAHVHHFYEFVLTHPEFPILPAIVRTVVQFTYTSVFGFFAAFVYLRTGSLYAAITAHVFCNWQGLPRLWGKVQAPNLDRTSSNNKKTDAPSTAEGTKAQSLASLGLIYTILYYVLLVVGAYGFYYFLWPLTESSNSLADLQAPGP